MINDAKNRGEVLRWDNSLGVYYFSPKSNTEAKKHWWVDSDYSDKYSGIYNKMIEKNSRHSS